MSRPRAKGTGTIFKPKGSRFYWVAYVSGGKRRFEGTKSERKQDAQALLTSRLRDFRKAWETACEKAGHPGKLFHDFRRSAVRTLERSGVPRSTAMAMVGHKTESIYRRYAIVDEQMHREAAAKLDTWADDQKAKAEAERKGQVKRFKQRRA